MNSLLKTLSFPRLSGWLLVALLLTLAVWWLAPQQLPVTLYKLSLVTVAAVAGYWIDRGLFPYARPDQIAGGLHGASSDGRIQAINAAMLRRAIIVAAAMLAMGLGA